MEPKMKIIISIVFILLSVPAFCIDYCQGINDKTRIEQIHFAAPLETYNVIEEKRLYFYSAPDEKCRISNDLFIIKNDQVVVYSEYEKFYFVMYVGKSRTVEGWVYKNKLKSTGNNIGTSDVKIFPIRSKAESSCKELTFKDDTDGSLDMYRSGTSCFYEKKSLSEIYTKYRKDNFNYDGQYLRERIPLKNVNFNIEKNSLNVSYKWLSKKELEIQLFFDGGITTLNFKEKKNGIEMKAIYDAD